MEKKLTKNTDTYLIQFNYEDMVAMYLALSNENIRVCGSKKLQTLANKFHKKIIHLDEKWGVKSNEINKRWY